MASPSLLVFASFFVGDQQMPEYHICNVLRQRNPFAPLPNHYGMTQVKTDHIVTCYWILPASNNTRIRFQGQILRGDHNLKDRRHWWQIELVDQRRTLQRNNAFICLWNDYVCFLVAINKIVNWLIHVLTLSLFGFCMVS